MYYFAHESREDLVYRAACAVAEGEWEAGASREQATMAGYCVTRTLMRDCPMRQKVEEAFLLRVAEIVVRAS